MEMRARFAAAAIALAAVLPQPAAANYNWNDLAAEFCRLTLSGDLSALRPILSEQLAADISAAAARTTLPPARVLFQSYAQEVPICQVRTRNAAIVEIQRSNPGGAAPAWTEYLVIVPEVDGTTRIAAVLFATRRSDTLRARLHDWAGR